jgi:hypothetical protein
MIEHLRRISPGIRSFMSVLLLIESFLCFFGGPLCVLAGIIVSAALSSSYYALVFVPTGIAAFLSGYFLFALSDLLDKFDQKADKSEAAVVGIGLNQLAKQLDRLMEQPVASKETPQPQINERKVEVVSTVSAVPSEPTVEENATLIQKQFRGILKAKGKEAAFEFISDAVTKEKISQEEYSALIDELK